MAKSSFNNFFQSQKNLRCDKSYHSRHLRRNCMKKTSACLSLLILLASCSTSYQCQNMFGNGFSETRTSPDSFIVNFQGNSYTKNDRIMKYAVRRASELCLQNGYKYFKIVHTLDTSNYSGSSGSINKSPALSLRIKCTTEKTNDGDEVDAKFFLENNL